MRHDSRIAKFYSRFFLDSVQSLLEGLGHLPARGRASSDGDGLHSIKNPQKQTAEIERHGRDVPLPSSDAPEGLRVRRRLRHKNIRAML